MPALACQGTLLQRQRRERVKNIMVSLLASCLHPIETLGAIGPKSLAFLKRAWMQDQRRDRRTIVN